jgi:hypothetical protein
MAYSLEVRVEIYKDATEKSLALAQKYLDSSGRVFYASVWFDWRTLELVLNI